MITTLDRKLFRDLGKMKGQIVAVSMVMACGLAMMIMARSIILSLETTRDSYYQQFRMPDVFGGLKRAPLSVADLVAKIPGVSFVSARVGLNATLDMEGIREPIKARLISLADDKPQVLNLLFLRTGRLPRSDEARAAVVSESFAEAHHLKLGDRLTAIINGHRDHIDVCGIGMSPEFVFEAPPGQTLPDNRHYGVFWMNYHALAVAYNMDGAFNDICLDLAPNVDPQQVIEEMDRLLASYGGTGAYSRSHHPSSQRLDDELRVVKALSVAYPIVFLSVAAFMVNSVLARLVRLQREQIAQLKALGYTSWQVGRHYMNYALVIVVIGSIIGSVAGWQLGGVMIRIYTLFFRFPELVFHLDYSALGLALIVSTGASVLGVTSVVWMAVKLSPAEAMRPEPPADFKPSFWERMGLTRGSSLVFRMALRNIERRPVQSCFTVAGLALAAGLMVLPGALTDSVDYLLTYQWNDLYRQDVMVFMREPSSQRTENDLKHLPGVGIVEPFRGFLAKMNHGHHERRVYITGHVKGGLLSRPTDTKGMRIVLPSEGIVISQKLAEVLGVRLGDSIQLQLLEGRCTTHEVSVRGLMADFHGLSAHMDINAMRRLLSEGSTMNGAFMTVDKFHWEDFMREVKNKPHIEFTSVRTDQLESFRSTTGKSIGTIRKLYLWLAIIVAFGVVYNSARIALSERGRDLATLRVVGLTQREIAGVLLGELSILVLVALPAGLLFGRALATFVILAVSNETVRLPLKISSYTYGMAVVVVFAASCASFLVVSRMLRSLDMVGVLKARD